MHRTNSTASRRRNGHSQSARVPTHTTGADRRVLLIEDNAADAKRIRGALAEARGGPFDVVCVRRLADGLECLRAGTKGAVFVDLVLPDSQGLDTLDELLLVAPQVPIVLLCGVDDEDIALRGLQRGARDYLLKAYLDSYSCSRALHNMIERKAMEDALFTEKERAQVTLDSIGDAVISTDTNSRITYLNLVAETMTGWHREDAIGRTMAEVFHVVDGKTREDCRNPMELVMQQGKTISLNGNCLLIRRDGAESSIEDSAAPIHDRQGRVTGAVIVARDVSAAKALNLKICEPT
jgi:PAS domain S-box-containing protein